MPNRSTNKMSKNRFAKDILHKGQSKWDGPNLSPSVPLNEIFFSGKEAGGLDHFGNVEQD